MTQVILGELLNHKKNIKNVLKSLALQVSEFAIQLQPVVASQEYTTNTAKCSNAFKRLFSFVWNPPFKCWQASK